ncbi:hypothetical protein pdam_00007319 [Pocillopora damicornis]|uniref:Uncharacterized protein n=1 Tax=Pocillopora damicornis TaxID=46731 RepID=A0A3M6V1J1_POCDA|nr:hypothetical protein pdam_00007319 [Pocillopora damicornis]
MSSLVNVHEQDMTDTSLSSSGDQKPLVLKERSCFRVVLVVIPCLLLIWGVSLLPTVFYANKLPVPTDPPSPNIRRCFPHIIPLYIQGLSSAIAVLIVVANGIGEEKAFCSSKFLAESSKNPTTFCTAQGVLIHYFCVALALWFVVYSVNLLKIKQELSTGQFTRSVTNVLKSFILLVIEAALRTDSSICPLNNWTLKGNLSVLVEETNCWDVEIELSLVRCISVPKPMIYSDSLVNLQGNHYRVQHIVYSLICWLLPFIPVGIVLGSESPPYIVVNMQFCFPGSTDTGYFTTTFITELALGVGVTCLFFVVYKLFMLRNISPVAGEQAKSRKKKMDKLVQRLVFLMFAYAAIVTLTYIPICLLQQHAALLEHHINRYFRCLMFYPPEKCHKNFEKL